MSWNSNLLKKTRGRNNMNRRRPSNFHHNNKNYRAKTAEARLGDGITKKTSEVSSKVLLIPKNGTLEGAVAIHRERTLSTLEVQPWASILYDKDFVPRKWILPILSYKEGAAELGTPYVEIRDSWGYAHTEQPELSERDQRKMSLLIGAVQKALAETEPQERKLSSSIKGHVRKNISEAHCNKAKGSETVFYYKMQLELPRPKQNP